MPARIVQTDAARPMRVVRSCVVLPPAPCLPFCPLPPLPRQDRALLLEHCLIYFHGLSARKSYYDPSPSPPEPPNRN